MLLVHRVPVSLAALPLAQVTAALADVTTRGRPTTPDRLLRNTHQPTASCSQPSPAGRTVPSAAVSSTGRIVPSRAGSHS
ncbi:hypothetical protein GCM10027269_48640 [Kribbella endophytica]